MLYGRLETTERHPVIEAGPIAADDCHGAIDIYMTGTGTVAQFSCSTRVVEILLFSVPATLIVNACCYHPLSLIL